jgi:hypothetical protein
MGSCILDSEILEIRSWRYEHTRNMPHGRKIEQWACKEDLSKRSKQKNMKSARIPLGLSEHPWLTSRDR